MRIVRLFFICLLLITSFTLCTSREKLSPEDQALISALNDAVAPFDRKEDVVQARGLFAESINKGLLDSDSLVMVESISDVGIYQCVAYVYHNRMITFYNAKKGVESADEFSKVQINDTPYEALTFIDAIQMNKFESFLTARINDIPQSEDWWLITFLSKNGETYSAKNYFSK